jgi:exonuclease SbcC
MALPEGCVAIVGENGAGKSSIVNLIDICLFGPESRSLADSLSDDAVGDLLLELTFEHGVQTFRVRRGYSSAGRGKTTLDFETLYPHPDVETWKPLTRESQKETQALIDEVLGLSRESFRASAFLMQGDGAAFTEALPRDRKRILADVLGLNIWERLHARVREDRRKMETGRERLAFSLEQAQAVLGNQAEVRQELEFATNAVSDWTRTVEEAKELVETLRSQIERDRVDVERVNRLRTLRQVCADDLVRLEEQVRKALEEQEYLARARAELASLPDAEAIGRLLRIQFAMSELAKLLERKLQLAYTKDKQTAVCPTCGQDLHDEALEAVQGKSAAVEYLIRERSAELNELGAGWATPEMVEDALAEARAGEGRRKELEAREKAAPPAVGRSKLSEAQAKLDEANSEYERAARGIRSEDALAALDAQLSERRNMLHEAERNLDAARERQWRRKSELERTEAATVEVEELGPALEAIDAKLAVYAMLERAFSRDGIPALIVETAAIPQIEADASRILAELGTPFRVELRTQRELKSGDGLREALDIVVVSEGGAVRPYETFSGGERTRINLALRIGLARLLSHRRGADSRVLVIDEPEFLDEPGTQALADVLRGLSEFDRIYLVSHVPTLRDAFDTAIVVTKENGRSEIAYPPDRAQTIGVAA